MCLLEADKAICDTIFWFCYPPPEHLTSTIKNLALIYNLQRCKLWLKVLDPRFSGLVLHKALCFLSNAFNKRFWEQKYVKLDGGNKWYEYVYLGDVGSEILKVHES